MDPLVGYNRVEVKKLKEGKSYVLSFPTGTPVGDILEALEGWRDQFLALQKESENAAEQKADSEDPVDGEAAQCEPCAQESE